MLRTNGQANREFQKRAYIRRRRPNAFDGVPRCFHYVRALALMIGCLLLGRQVIIAQSNVAAVAPGGKWCSGPVLSNNRAVSWRKLPSNTICDQKKIWTFPRQLNHSGTLVPAMAVAVGTAGLILLDHSDAPYFRRTTAWGSFNQGVSGTNAALATVLAPVALYGFGFVRHDFYEQNTALLAGEAAVDAELVSFVLKDATRRLRPREILPNGNFADTWYERPNWTGASGFPSGHSIVAFSIATVLARRYGNHRWLPYVAYGSAALIGISRITSSAHFPSDVFFGAALGYGIGRFAVLQ